jgi:hypothetical protein
MLLAAQILIPSLRCVLIFCKGEEVSGHDKRERTFKVVLIYQRDTKKKVIRSADLNSVLKGMFSMSTRAKRSSGHDKRERTLKVVLIYQRDTKKRLSAALT